MIACIAPSDRFFEENVSTLSYATRASNIANAPTKNIDPKIKEILELKAKNKSLQLELANANKHIEYLTSLTSEELQSFGNNLITEKFGDRDLSIKKLDTSSPVKPKGKIASINPPTVPKVTSKTNSVGVSSGMMASSSGVSTETQTRFNQQAQKKSARGKSKDQFLSIEKRESIEDIAKRKFDFM